MYTKFIICIIKVCVCVCSYPCTLQSLTFTCEIFFLMFFLFDGRVPFQFFMRPQKFCGCIMFCRCHDVRL